MAKYSFEFKKKVVKDYLEGKGGCGYLANHYGIPNKCIVQRWIKAHESLGDEGLMRSRKNEKYTFEYKLTYVSVITMVSSFSRILVSRYFGKLADKTSWASMMTICFVIAGLGFFIQSFTVPENGKLFFLFYSVLYALSLAGINGGLINIVFDYVDEADRTAALGVKTAIGGICGFLASLLGGKLLESHTSQRKYLSRT